VKSEVSRRYAKALYQLAKESNKLDRIFSEIRTLGVVLTSDKVIIDFVSSPLLSSGQKQAAIRAALGANFCEEVINLALLLVDKGRLDIFSHLVESFEEMNDRDHGVTRGVVRSASPLGAESRKQVEEIVTAVTKNKVILNFTEDPQLLGGMVAQVGGWTFDDSLETHLTRMSEELNRSTH